MHRGFGFRDVGRYQRVGWKHNLWHDVAWMQRDLQTAEATPHPDHRGASADRRPAGSNHSRDAHPNCDATDNEQMTRIAAPFVVHGIHTFRVPC